MNTARPLAPVAALDGSAVLVFVAALGPMMTVPALRRLVIETHGQTPAMMHVFVALGMLGSAIGAPLVASRVDRGLSRGRMIAFLALADACVALASSLPIPTLALFLLRPIHGLASMGALSLAFSRYRRHDRLVGRGGAAMIIALAVGPAIGGALVRHSPMLPFRVAAVSALVVAALATRDDDGAPARARAPGGPGLFWQLRAPLSVVASQRFALGGLVAAFALQARVLQRLDDAQVGRCFSVLLVVFALTMAVSGRTRIGTRLAPIGALLFAVGLSALAFAPFWSVVPALALAGVGAAWVYAPCLAAVGRASIDRRSTAMALFHAAGAVGMVLGPLVAAAIEVALRAHRIEVRTGSFMILAGVQHAVVTWFSKTNSGEMENGRG